MASEKTAAALCIAATLVSVAAPAMAVSPAEYMSTAALEECNTATVAQVESLINQIGTVTTARRPAIVAAVNAYNELDDASKAQVSNFAVLAEAQQVLGLKDALAKLKISYDKVEDARSYVSPTEDRLSNQGKRCGKSRTACKRTYITCDGKSASGRIMKDAANR